MPIGRPLPKLKDFGARSASLGKPKRVPAPSFTQAKGAKLKVPKSLNYAKIKEQVMAAIARLPGDKRALIPQSATLPEAMVCLALVWLGWTFQAQVNTDGGRLRLGGAVVDVKVWLGGQIIVIRVQGDWWHSQPVRKHKDAVQWTRLHALGYRVFDAWEGAIYLAWVEGRLQEFVRQGVLSAA